MEVVGCITETIHHLRFCPRTLLDNLKVIAENYDYVFIEGAALKHACGQ
jgi:hypothetical protein